MKYLLTIVFPLLLWGCATTKSTTTASGLYTEEQEWPVSINDGWLTAKTISFGPYKTTPRVNGPITTFIRNQKDPFYFYLEGNGARINIQSTGATGVSFSSQVLPKYFNTLAPNVAVKYSAITNGFKSNIPASDTLFKWEMIVKAAHYLELNSNKPVGVLRVQENPQGIHNNLNPGFRINANNRFGKVNSYENICYEFYSDNNKLIAAVVPGEKPRVWMDKHVDNFNKNLLAAAIASLLL
jgi:hypothetical protein